MIAEVIVDVLSSNVDKVFDYLLPENSTIEIGDRVVVPFASRQIDGFVINIKETSSYDATKLKQIISKKDAQPLLSQNMVRLCFFMKQKFFIRLADAIRLFLPPAVRNGKIKEKVVNILFLNCDEESFEKVKKSPKQLQALIYLKEKGSEKQTELNKKFGASAISTLIKKELIKIEAKKENRKPQNNFTVNKKEIILNSQQTKAVETITHSNYNTFLLHGVTGSGKTEVYINCIKNALNNGKTAIMLVPEISLTPQMFARFKNAFGDTVAILHSGLSNGQRFDEWNRLRSGEAKIVIGPRSSLFAPLSDIGIIVIDEEHDGSYYSESNPRFHTHEVARFLAYLNNCPLILGSATPSIESFHLAQKGEYYLISLTERANKHELPSIEIVDMLSEIHNGNTGIFSTKFLTELETCIKNGKQAMIFINRRGFSSFLMCRECGYVPKCEDCDVSLVYHKEDDMLKCHYCNRRYRVLNACPKCKSTSIRYGAVGTQRVVEELRKIFNSTPIFRLDNDATQNKNSYIEILENFNQTSPAILVGTQMIAKGHDFNNVTLVGIVDADISLHFSDYRAIERTFQLITQVSGRAGRSDSEGKVILQTYYPKHFVYRCASNYDFSAFFKKELNLREVSHFPPFVRILRILVLGEDENKVLKTLEELFNQVKQLKATYTSDFIYLQAMKCPKKRLQKNYRYQILFRIYKKNADEIISQVYAICDKIKKQNTSIFIENDPQNLS